MGLKVTPVRSLVFYLLTYSRTNHFAVLRRVLASAALVVFFSKIKRRNRRRRFLLS